MQARLNDVEQLQWELRHGVDHQQRPGRTVDAEPGYVDIDVPPSPHRLSTKSNASSGASPPHRHRYCIDAVPDSHEAVATTQLRMLVPTLSDAFRCSNTDANMLLAAVTATSRCESRDRSEDVLRLEGEVKHLSQRLERRADEIARLKDEAAESKQKLRAVEAQTKQSMTVLSQRREETRKQLLIEESKNSKLHFQVKTLQAEVDKLKARLHQALSR